MSSATLTSFDSHAIARAIAGAVFDVGSTPVVAYQPSIHGAIHFGDAEVPSGETQRAGAWLEWDPNKFSREWRTLVVHGWSAAARSEFLMEILNGLEARSALVLTLEERDVHDDTDQFVFSAQALTDLLVAACAELGFESPLRAVNTGSLEALVRPLRSMMARSAVVA